MSGAESVKAEMHNVSCKYYTITHLPFNVVHIRLEGAELGMEIPSSMLNQFQKDYKRHVYRPHVRAKEIFRLVFDVSEVPDLLFLNSQVVQIITQMLQDMRPFTTVHLVSSSVICHKDSMLRKIIKDTDPASNHRLVTDNSADAFEHLALQLAKATEGRDGTDGAAFWASPVPGRDPVLELPRDPMVL